MIPSRSASLKRDIEASLASRIPSALSPVCRQPSRLLTTGNPSVDALLDGGLPLGSISEITGPASSGRTSLAQSLLAPASLEAACAWIDASDTLSPYSVAAAGVELRNLLWVRCCSQPGNTAAGPRRAPADAVNAIRPSDGSHSRGGHPRLESRNMAPALQHMLFLNEERRQRKTEGTPGHPNQPMSLGRAPQEQIEWERFNSRKVDETDPLWRMDKRAAEEARRTSTRPSPHAVVPQSSSGSMHRLGQAIRATDQVLQSGGFRVVVLDLASIAPEQALRVPSATWFRFRRAAQESDALLLLLTLAPCAQSSAACVLQCFPGQQPKVHSILTRTDYSVEVARQRSGPAHGKKAPGRDVTWGASPEWMNAVGL